MAPADKPLIEINDANTPKGAAFVRDRLEDHGLLRNDDRGLQSERGKLIVGEATDLIDSSRLSPRNDERLKRFVKQREKYELRNESTFIIVMWWILVREDRTVKKTQEDQNKIDGDVLIRAWDKDGLTYNLDENFTKGYFPGLDTTGEAALAELLKKPDGITTPRPDLVYGLEKEVFGDQERTANDLHPDLSALSNGAYHPFFTIEFKSYKGDMGEAMNQASRNGAVILYTMSLLKEKAGTVDKDQEYDDGSYAFSLTLDPGTAHMWVHWREERQHEDKVKVLHHMHRIKQYPLTMEDSVEDLRIAINNILQWGVDKRRKFLETMLEALEQNASQTASTAKSKSTAAKKSATAPEEPEEDASGSRRSQRTRGRGKGKA